MNLCLPKCINRCHPECQNVEECAIPGVRLPPVQHEQVAELEQGCHSDDGVAFDVLQERGYEEGAEGEGRAVTQEHAREVRGREGTRNIRLKK